MVDSLQFFPVQDYFELRQTPTAAFGLKSTRPVNDCTILRERTGRSSDVNRSLPGFHLQKISISESELWGVGWGHELDLLRPRACVK